MSKPVSMLSLVFLLATVPVGAQQNADRFEFSVFANHNFLDAETVGIVPLISTTVFPPVRSGGFEGGFGVGVRFGYRVNPRATIEAAYRYAPSNRFARADFIILEDRRGIEVLRFPEGPGGRDNRGFFRTSFTTQDVGSHGVTTNVLYHVTTGPFAPFFTAGLGAEIFDVGNDVTRTNFTWNLGGGIRYRLRSGLYARFDAREVFITDFFATRRTENAVELSLGLVIGF